MRWVGGVEIELIAMATGARIIPRFSEISPEKLGRAGKVREVGFGTSSDKMLQIEGCSTKKAVTILVRGGSRVIIDEAMRCLHDAICVVRNMIRSHRVVPGGGASEIAAGLAINRASDRVATVEQYAMRAFADALEDIPLALSENSGLPGVEEVSRIKARQMNEGNPYLGIDAMLTGSADMSE